VIQQHVSRVQPFVSEGSIDRQQVIVAGEIISDAAKPAAVRRTRAGDLDEQRRKHNAELGRYALHARLGRWLRWIPIR
jgi:hypothetical protein